MASSWICSKSHLNLHNDTHQLTAADKMKSYHAQLRAMLRILGEIQSGQDTMLENAEINLFGECILLDVICLILFFSVKTLPVVKLCGHYSNY
jgi:hypothetical protein